MEKGAGGQRDRVPLWDGKTGRRAGVGRGPDHSDVPRKSGLVNEQSSSQISCQSHPALRKDGPAQWPCLPRSVAGSSHGKHGLYSATVVGSTQQLGSQAPCHGTQSDTLSQLPHPTP